MAPDSERDIVRDPGDGFDDDRAPLIRLASLTPTRWSNGLGETVEVWRAPVEGAFDVRLSIATVATDTAFSSLPGIDRALMALAPRGLSLRIDGTLHALARYDTVDFAGEAEAGSIDVHESGQDLNLMVRRGRGMPRLAAVRVDGRLTTDEVQMNDLAGLRAVVALTDGLTSFGRLLAVGDTVVVPLASRAHAGNPAADASRPAAAADARTVAAGIRGHGLVALAVVSEPADSLTP